MKFHLVSAVLHFAQHVLLAGSELAVGAPVSEHVNIGGADYEITITKTS